MLRLATSLADAGLRPTVHWYNQDSTFHRLPAQVAGGPLPKRSAGDPRFWRALHAAVRAADVVHAWLPYPGVYAGLAGLDPRAAPVLHGVRCAPELFDWQPTQARATLTATALSRAVTANATTMVKWLVARGTPAERVHHLPNQLAPTLYDRPLASADDNRAALSALGLDPNRPPIVCLGRFDHNKNQLGLLRALARVKASHRDGELPPLVLAGDVQDRAVRREAERLIGESGLDARILAPVADPAALLAASRLSVLASLSEGSPNVVLEGLAVGALTLSTRVGEVSELVREGQTGFTCAVADDDALAAGLAQALALPAALAQQMGKQARADVRARFGAAAIAQQYIALYQRIASERWGRIGPRPAMAR